MTYFSRFPMMIYDVKGNDNYKLLPDILRRVKQRAGIKAGDYIVRIGDQQVQGKTLMEAVQLMSCLLYTSPSPRD